MAFSFDFSSKTVFVAGGGSGIGAAVALAFGRAGANVILTYHSSGEAAERVVNDIEASGQRALAIEADLTDPAAVERAFQATRPFGRLDVLFTNAGGLLQRTRTVDSSPELWTRAFNVNVMSTFLCCRAALKLMETQKAGAIVTMASLAAFDGGGMGASHYAASKGAIVSYTRALAKEVGPLGIRVNGVAPGLIGGTAFHDTFSTLQGRAGTVANTPLRREGRPDDVASAVLYLASDAAAFITGEIVQINGGSALH
jgi:3-oxoacyl-[acyl-carrier protein] reductase